VRSLRCWLVWSSPLDRVTQGRYKLVLWISLAWRTALGKLQEVLKSLWWRLPRSHLGLPCNRNTRNGGRSACGRGAGTLFITFNKSLLRCLWSRTLFACALYVVASDRTCVTSAATPIVVTHGSACCFYFACSRRVYRSASFVLVEQGSQTRGPRGLFERPAMLFNLQTINI